MRPLESGALTELARVLGITAGQEQTDVDMAVLQTTLDVGPIVRRSRTIGLSEGIFSGRLANAHVAAATVTATVDPYAPGTVAAAGFPKVVPVGFDMWLLHTAAYRDDGDALISARLALEHPARSMAFVPSGGANSLNQVLRAYNIALLSEVVIGSANYFRSVGDGLIGLMMPVRVPRGTNLIWETKGAGSTSALYIADVVLGLFPHCLGHDAT